MRTLRPFLSGLVTLGLLASLGTPALGQDSSDTYVSGTSACMIAGAVSMHEVGSVEFSTFPGRCLWEMSDPRVSGISESMVERACFREARDNCYFWGSLELTGPDGTWVGAWSGIRDEELGDLPSWSVMEGTEAYAGWTFVTFIEHQSESPERTLGIIYEGPPPPWGEWPPVVAAE